MNPRWSTARKGPRCVGVGLVVVMDEKLKMTCPHCNRTFKTQPRYRYLGNQSILPVHTSAPYKDSL